MADIDDLHDALQTIIREMVGFVHLLGTCAMISVILLGLILWRVW